MRRDEDAKENGEFFMPKREKQDWGTEAMRGSGRSIKFFLGESRAGSCGKGGTIPEARQPDGVCASCAFRMTVRDAGIGRNAMIRLPEPRGLDIPEDMRPMRSTR